MLLVFGVYPQMHTMDPSSSSILQKTAAINKGINEVQKIRAGNQVADTLNIRNELLVDLVYDLPLNFDVPVWRKDNVRRINK